MSDEMFQGLAVDLTTVLERRNNDCAKAGKIISRLITALILDTQGSEERRREAITEGREWLANYYARVPSAKEKL